MESYGMELTKHFQNLHITRHKKITKRKNEYYDEKYFPKSAKVKIYADKSPDRSYWLKHPSQIELKWTIDLSPGTRQFEAVANPLKKSLGSIKIYNIYKIDNKFLQRQYELKKELKELDAPCEEYKLYHFTVEKALSGIITNNFNWRMSGLSRGHKYGYGISFSPDPKWAQQFCQNKGVKVLLVVHVLFSKVQLGEKGMVLPNYSFDTSASPNKTVYVKFEDSEFCPKYLVYYNRR